MHKTSHLLKSIGNLVIASRTTTMDQTELGQRVGVARSTISAIENGKAVNTETLCRVLEHLDLIDDFQSLVDEKLQQQNHTLVRKARKQPEELDNDF